MDDDKPRRDAGSEPEGQAKPPSAPAAEPAGPAAPMSRSLARLQEAKGRELEAVEQAGATPIVRVKREAIAEVCRFLKDDLACRMVHLSNLCGVDLVERGRPAPRFDVVYHLFSLETGERMALKVAVPDGAEVPSVTSVWRTANWHEREAYDMFGIRFTGHPDLRRILMPDEFDAHPLRKDFPLEGRAADHGYWRRPEDEVGK